MRRAALVISMAVLLFATTPATVTHGQGGGADFTRFVGVGDSLTAGFRDGALFASAQQQGFYKLVADAAGADVVLPLIAEPGIPTPNPAAGAGRLIQNPGTCAVGQFTYATGQTTGRLNPTVPATDVAVPGQSVGDALTIKWSITVTGPGQVDPATVDSAEDFILGFPYAFLPPPANTPRTQIETAAGLQPTFVSFWLGSNDALGAALLGEPLTPVADFNTNVDTAVGALTTASPNLQGVLLNVPDVTVIPNLFSLADLGALTGLSDAQVRLLFKLKKGSFVPLSALPTIQAIAAGDPNAALSANQILTKKEVKQIRKAIKAYNKKLKAVADAQGWAYVDVNAILTDYDKNGVTVPGVGTLTTDYLGGIFGLDGVHPSATGHALIATTVIQAINAKYGTTFAPPDVAAIAAADPQVCMAANKTGATLADIASYAPAALAAESVIAHKRTF